MRIVLAPTSMATWRKLRAVLIFTSRLARSRLGGDQNQPVARRILGLKRFTSAGREAELKRGSFVELYTFGDPGIEVVERSVASYVPWRIAEGRAEDGLSDSGIGDVPNLIVRYRLDRRSARRVKRIEADQLS